MSVFSRELPLVNGVYNATTKDFYWGVVSREDMHVFLKSAEAVGFSQALTDTNAFSVEKLRGYATDTDRADFVYLLPLSSEASVLDLGSGYGNITIPLSRFFKEITAVDASSELLNFSRLRAKELDRENITYVHADSFEYLPLPFKDKSFDCVILNGVLEWVGNGAEAKDPKEYQEAFLREMVRILKDDGILYLAIENRWFPGWFMRDPHSKLPFTVFLPRGFASWYMRRKTGVPYRTYIYGKSTYKAMLKKAGFTTLRTYLPQSTYRAPKIILPESGKALRYSLSLFGRNVFTFKWQIFLWPLSIFNLHPFVVSSFMFIAGKRELSKELVATRVMAIGPVVEIGKTGATDGEVSLFYRRKGEQTYTKGTIVR